MTLLRPARRGLLVGCLLALAACTPTFDSTPAPAGDATAAARTMVIQALGSVGLQAHDAIQPYRPSEAPRFTAAPRTVLQATLPDDPGHGFIVLYAFSSPAHAAAAAAEQAAYIGSGPGRVQFGKGARFVLRVIDTTAIFFTWVPDSSPDPRTASIDQALSTLGTAFEIPG